ncbi:hypothetical protein L873DRAFT_200806 [Choiromyces venosus 120613-1]|uniref:Uncharacterized protein n=1 Tax=Choiromyces venosus 120613-1 TaxID=1336337 RepID=A0A3N4J1T0_9PEZI|nr:hypothetical protein L873DRAFT_200806 [Choiromyces venosus 120613-1]
MAVLHFDQPGRTTVQTAAQSLSRAPPGPSPVGYTATRFLLSNSLRTRDPLRFVQHAPQHAIAFTLLRGQYTVLSTLRLVVCG